MNPLLKRLSALRLKVRLLEGWQGICFLVALVLGVTVAIGGADFALHLPNLVRAAVLIALLVGSGAIFYRYLVRPFGKPCDNLNLALRVEEEYPELNDALASTVQFLSQTDKELARVGGSPAMRERTVAETIEKASKCDFSRILDRRSAVMFGFAAMLVTVAAGTVVYLQPDYSRIALLRFLEPFGEHTWTRVQVARLKNEKIESVDPYKQEKVAFKQAYHIKVNLSGQLPERLKNAKIEVDGQIKTDTTEPIVRDDDGGAFFIKRFDMLAQKQKFKFKIVYNDGAFPPRSGTWHEVEVLPEPKLVPLDNLPSPQITLYPPAYTGLPAEKHVPAGMRNMEMVAGTKARFRAKADRPLKEAYIVYSTSNTAVVPAAMVAAGFGQLDPFTVAARTFAEHQLWTRIPVKLLEDGSVMQAEFTPWLDGKYELVMNDEYELEGRENGDVHVLADPLPKLNVRFPGSTVTANPDGKVNFKFNVTDEQFGIKSVYAEFRRRDKDGAEDAVQKILLYDANGFGKLLPDNLLRLSDVAPLSMRSFPRPDLRDARLPNNKRIPDLRLRHQKLDFNTIWNLRKQFKEGDVITIEFCADDFCDVFSVREPGKSTQIEIRILSVRQLVQQAERDLNKIQNDIKRAAQQQKKALDTVKETQKKDKLDQNDVNNFIDNAEGPQRTVRDIIGPTPKDGVRKDLAELREMLKSNNLENTQVARDAKRTEGVMQNLAQEELQQLEPRIADARNDLTQNNKNTPESKKKLEEIAKLENQVLKGLDELIERMEPNAKMNDQRTKLRDIIQAEKQNLADIEKMKAEKIADQENFPNKREQIEKLFQEGIEEKAIQQRELAQQTEKLIKEMKQELEEQQKLGNKENAEKLKEAIERLEKPKPDPRNKDEIKAPLNAQMKELAQELGRKKEAQDQQIKKQEKIIEQLENALEAVEGRNEDMTKQDIQERQQQEKRIDQLKDKVQKLREDFKKAELLEDMEEKLKKKEELAKEHDKVVEEIEKTRRELAQLQEQRAANELKEAADKVDQARQKMQNNQNPDDDLREAQKQLEQAKQDLKESEEHLARELLIKIHDQLKQVKERQDAVLQRSEDFHPKITRIKSWSEPLLDTIKGNIDAQKDIADETDGLKTKLKEAKVFHSILERAKKSMDDAGTEMTARSELGKERRYIDEGKGPDERMDAKELKEENESQETTVKFQKDAAKRLDRLLDALKEEIAQRPKPQPPKEKDGQAKGEKDPKEKGPKNPPPGDGLPSKAQLKALHGEQMDLKERTEEFAKKNPDPAKLNDAQKRELRELADDQERLQTLFGEIIAPPQVPMPMPNEGEQKK